MDLLESRTWIIFYLISFVVLLVAVFLTSEGVLLGVGLTMIIVVIGINFLFVVTQVKASTKRKELMERISHREKRGEDSDDQDLPV